MMALTAGNRLRASARRGARRRAEPPFAGAWGGDRRSPMGLLAGIRAGCAGQSSVELVAMLPLLVAVALAVLQLLAAGAARALAGHAAEAGAVALLEGGDPSAAARDAVPGWAAAAVAVRVEGRRVDVRLRPPAVIPPLARALTAEARADAGSSPEDAS